MKRLLEIDAVCNPDRQRELEQAQNDNLDKFTRQKRNMAKFYAEITLDIQNRDAARGSDSPSDFAKRGFEIREKIKRFEDMGDDLEQIHKKKEFKTHRQNRKR